MVGFGLPVAAYFWFIHQYGVNVPREDQWSDVSLIGRSYSGTLGFANLWAAHNDHRILFPNLLAVLLGRTTHLNLFVEMYLSAILLVVAVGLLIITHKRRSPTTPWIYYCPVAIVMFSFAQYQDTLWGFQIAWYLVIAALAAVLYLLDRPVLSWVALSAAILLAVVGSYSLFQGLLIWPVGLLLMVQRRRTRSAVLAWVIAAVLTGIGYFFRLQSPPNRFYVVHHPITALKLFFLAIGDIFAQPTPFSGDTAILLVGLLTFVIAAYAVIRYGLRGDETTGRPLGVALILFGLLFAASADIGTASVFGAWVGTNSLYVINILLILVGCYLVVLNRPSPKGTRAFPVASWLVGVVVVGMMCTQVVLSIINGVSGGRSTQQAASVAADVLVNIDRASKQEVRSAFVCPRIGNRVGLSRWSPWCPGGTLSPDAVGVLRSHHLALFGTGVSATDAKEGLVVPPESLGFSSNGATSVQGVAAQTMTYVVNAVGTPAPSISSRDLPAWVTVVDHHDGSATLSATNPPVGTTHFVLSAINRAGAIDEPFFIRVRNQQSPVFVSGDTKTCYVGAPCSVSVRAQGWPTPAISERGRLPSGVKFTVTSRGASLSGRVADIVPSTYVITLRASTGVGPPAVQTLRLTVR